MMNRFMIFLAAFTWIGAAVAGVTNPSSTPPAWTQSGYDGPEIGVRDIQRNGHSHLTRYAQLRSRGKGKGGNRRGRAYVGMVQDIDREAMEIYAEWANPRMCKQSCREQIKKNYKRRSGKRR